MFGRAAGDLPGGDARMLSWGGAGMGGSLLFGALLSMGTPTNRV